jgi:hypothetical protein
MVQISTVLVIADFTMVGYALQQKMPAIIWISSILPVTMTIINWKIFDLVVPILATAISIEAEHPHPSVDGLVSNFVAVRYSVDFLETLRQASRLETSRQRALALRQIKEPNRFSLRSKTNCVLYIIMVGHLLLPFYLHYSWKGSYWSQPDSHTHRLPKKEGDPQYRLTSYEVLRINN